MQFLITEAASKFVIPCSWFLMGSVMHYKDFSHGLGSKFCLPTPVPPFKLLVL